MDLCSNGDQHAAMRVLNQRNDLTGTHVAFRGFGPGIEAVAKGEIDTMLPDVGSALGILSSGKLRAIGVTTRTRTPVLPDVPTYREQGFDFDIELWFGIFVKAGTPPEILKRLTDEVKYALSLPDIQARWGPKARKIPPSLNIDSCGIHAISP